MREGSFLPNAPLSRRHKASTRDTSFGHGHRRGGYLRGWKTGGESVKKVRISDADLCRTAVQELRRTVEANGGPEDPRIEVEIRLRRRETSGASRTLNESEHAFWRESLLGFLCVGEGSRPEAKEHPIIGERIWNLKECGMETDRIRQAYPFRHDGGVWGEAECMVKRAIWHCDLDLASGYRLRICLSKEHRLESSEALGLLSELAILRQESGVAESARRNGPVPDLIRFKRRLTFERPEWDLWIDSTEVVTKRPRPEGDSSSDLTCFEASPSQSTVLPEALELEVEFRPCRGIFDSVERVLKACQDISREG